jgi:spore coat polysaccharide biosynthesis protein SpsF
MTRPHTVAIIQARMASSRLPGKVLLDIAGEPMLAHVVARARLARSLDQVVVATTTEPDDEPIQALCEERGLMCYRGSQYDVLDRYYQAALQSQAEVVVRITADCPLIDPDVIDRTVNAFMGATSDELKTAKDNLQAFDSELTGDRHVAPGAPYDFAANRLPPPWGRTYPIGLDTEVCTFKALEIAWKEAKEPHQREHVMPFFYDHQERFRILLINYTEDYGAMRWTVDTPEDLELVRQVYARFTPRADFSWLEVLELFRNEPRLARINAEVRHKAYDEIDARRRTTDDQPSSPSHQS